MQDWKKYYEKTGLNGPTPFAKETAEFVQNKERAIDLGAGSLKDTIYFTQSGFNKVIALDSSSAIIERLPEDLKDKIECIVSKFEDYDFPVDYFDLVYSKVSLQFIVPDKFDATLDKIICSVTEGGIIAISTLGPNDAWSMNIKMSFITLGDLENRLTGFEILMKSEKEYDKPPALGGPSKHWHIVNIIAKKK